MQVSDHDGVGRLLLRHNKVVLVLKLTLALATIVIYNGSIVNSYTGKVSLNYIANVVIYDSYRLYKISHLRKKLALVVTVLGFRCL